MPMPVIRGIVVGVVGAALVFAVAASQPAAVNGASLVSDSQALSPVSATSTRQQSGEVVWGKVPYCNCFSNSATANVDTATDNVTGALKKANLTVSLKELSPQDGWLYFTVTFDPHTATREQVSAAMVAGGGQVLDGPP